MSLKEVRRKHAAKLSSEVRDRISGMTERLLVARQDVEILQAEDSMGREDPKVYVALERLSIRLDLAREAVHCTIQAARRVEGLSARGGAS